MIEHEVTLTAIEARLVRMILVNWINEMGSLMCDSSREDEEIVLRSKFEISAEASHG